MKEQGNRVTMLSSFVPAATMAACILVLLQQAVTADDGGDSGSYFVVYEGDAPTKCVVEAGVAVDDDCCTNVGPLFGLVRDTYPSTCYILSGLLGEDGGSLEAYLGCDDGIPKYGEACYEESADTGGIIPLALRSATPTPPALKNAVAPSRLRAMDATRFATFPIYQVSKTTHVRYSCG